MQINQLPSTSTVNSTDVLVKETSGGTTEKIAIGDFVVNNLTSTATDKPLAAAQGKAINDKLNTRTAPNSFGTAGRVASNVTTYTVEQDGYYVIPVWATANNTNVELKINGTQLFNLVTSVAYQGQVVPINIYQGNVITCGTNNAFHVLKV